VRRTPIWQNPLAQQGFELSSSQPHADRLHSPLHTEKYQEQLRGLREDGAMFQAQGLELLVRSMEMHTHIAFDRDFFFALLRHAPFSAWAHNYFAAFRSWAERQGAAQACAFEEAYLWVLMLHWAALLPPLLPPTAEHQHRPPAYRFWRVLLEPMLTKVDEAAALPSKSSEAAAHSQRLAHTAARIRGWCTVGNEHTPRFHLLDPAAA